MPRTIELRAERARVWNEMQALLESAENENRDFGAEERQSWDRMNEQVNSLGERITRAEEMEARQREQEGFIPTGNNGHGPPEDPEQRETEFRAAFSMFLRHGMGALEPEQRRLLRVGTLGPGEVRAAGVATGAAGGFFVPTGFRRQIIETQKFFGSVRAVAEVITTDSGNDLPWPTNDDTANVGAILAENTAVTEQDVTLGQATLKAYMYTSKLVRVSFQLLQDSAFDVEDFLRRKLAERIERILNQHFTTGTGTSQPQGVQTGATVGKTGATGQTTSVTYDDLIDLIHSVDVAYRNERSAFMLRDGSLASVRKLKDANNLPLWQPSVQAGVPDTLLGQRVIVNNDMPAMAASVKSILFGDFVRAYVVRDVADFQLLRLEERYADFLQVGFLGFSRHDGLVQDAGAVKAYSNSAT